MFSFVSSRLFKCKTDRSSVVTDMTYPVTDAGKSTSLLATALMTVHVNRGRSTDVGTVSITNSREVDGFVPSLKADLSHELNVCSWCVALIKTYSC